MKPVLGSEKRIPTVLYYTGLRNKVRKRVEKYFFNTSETVTTVDISTFIKGGIN
jgi:hypothetical protein